MRKLIRKSISPDKRYDHREYFSNDKGLPKPIFEKYQLAICTYFVGNENMRKPVRDTIDPSKAKTKRKNILSIPPTLGPRQSKGYTW